MIIAEPGAEDGMLEQGELERGAGELLAELRGAMARSDAAAVLRIGRLLTAAWPSSQPLAIEVTAALRALGRWDDADATLLRLLEQDENSPELLLHYGLNAETRADWPETLRRWTLLESRQPDLPIGRFRRALSLREMGELGEADALLCSLHEELPKLPDVAYHWAVNPHYDKSPATAVERWAAIRFQWPDDPVAYGWGVCALDTSGRHAEADALLADAEARFPGNKQIMLEAAELHGRRGEWVRARTLLEQLQAQFPSEPSISISLRKATLQASYHRVDEEADPGWQAAAAPVPVELQPADFAETPAEAPAPLRETPDLSALWNVPALMANFESLGGDCELGLIQRHHESEPLGLLRWGGPNLDGLVRAFRERFKGLGASGTIRLEEQHDEYFLRETVYGMSMHTFIPVDPARKDKLLAQLERRMGFLSRRLLEDVASGRRIFVFKEIGLLEHDQMRTLHDAMLDYGPATLLVMQQADEAHPATAVEKLRDGLFVGYVSAFGNAPLKKDGRWNIRFQEWISICRIVFAAAPPRGA